MLQFISTNSEKIIGFSITGKIQADDIDKVTHIIEERLKNHDKVRIYAEINRMQGISLPAFFKDLNFSFKHFGDFEKEAIVADAIWLKRFAQLGDTILPNIEVKHFPLANKKQALEWVNS